MHVNKRANESAYEHLILIIGKVLLLHLLFGLHGANNVVRLAFLGG